jgi:hemolysin activation/secretion protein
MKTNPRLISLALLLVASVSLARAQVTPAATAPAPVAATPALEPAAGTTYDPFTLRLGGFLLSSINTKLTLSAGNGAAGTEVDFVNALGGSDSANVFRADGEWRFATKHKVQLSFFDISLNASRSISTSINWGDQVFPINTVITSSFKTTVYKLNYGYIFYQTPTQEVSFLAGLHITRFSTSLGASSLGKVESASATAPLPVFGFEWKSQLSDKLSSQVSYEYFGLSIDNKYSGNLSDFQAMLEYHFSPNWSLGAGYNRYVLNAKVKMRLQSELRLRHNYNGLMLFVSTRF